MAIKKISRTEEIEKKLKKESKVRYIEPTHPAILRMNKEMAEVRREFRAKQARSERSAKNSFFTC